MKVIKLICLIFFLLSIAKYGLAFQDDYNAVDSRTRVGLADLRQIYNAPKSLCRKDGIPDHQCGRVSLRFGGDTFKEVFYDVNLANYPKSEFERLTKPEINSLVNAYLLPTKYPDKSWQVPTLGQLTKLIQEGFVPAVTGKEYWYKNPSNQLESAFWLSRQSTQGIASLTRLVSSDYESACEYSKCNDWKRHKDYRICVTYYDLISWWRYQIFSNGRWSADKWSGADIYGNKFANRCYGPFSTADTVKFRGCTWHKSGWGGKEGGCYGFNWTLNPDQVDPRHASPVFCFQHWYKAGGWMGAKYWYESVTCGF